MSRKSLQVNVVVGTIPIAVSSSEEESFGCPYCGYRSATMPISMGGCGQAVCGECGQAYVVLADGLEQSTLGFSSYGSPTVFPNRQDHPRRGIPSHGNPDKRPDIGGEFFHSRGIGSEWNLACFCCGAADKLHRPPDDYQPGNGLLNNIAAFVQCKDSGERIVAMFPQGARLDYRDYEPDRVQVKIGACDQHLPNLKRLDQLTRNPGIITAGMIAEAQS